MIETLLPSTARRAVVALPVPATGRTTIVRSGHFEVVDTARPDDLLELFRLRRRVFAAEFRVAPPVRGLDDLDHDAFDPHCRHLAVRDLVPGRIVGGYRLLLPDGATRAGGLYAEGEFDLTALRPIRAGLVELGRACIAESHRNGIVLMLLWKAILRVVAVHGGRHLIGCCSLPIADGGVGAARLYARLVREHAAPAHLRVQPRCPLPVEALPAARPSGPGEPPLPALLRGYLRAGCRILGAPHLDRAFGSADIPLLLALDRLEPRFAARLDRPLPAEPAALALTSLR